MVNYLSFANKFYSHILANMNIVEFIYNKFVFYEFVPSKVLVDCDATMPLIRIDGPSSEIVSRGLVTLPAITWCKQST